MRHKKLTVLFVVLCGLCLLLAWDVHTIRRRVLEDFSPYDGGGGIAQVRKHGGEEGVFRVLFSNRLSETNKLLAARSRLQDTGNSETIHASGPGNNETRPHNHSTPRDQDSYDDDSSPGLHGHHDETRTAKEEVVPLLKRKGDSGRKDFSTKHDSIVKQQPPQRDQFETIFNSTHSLSDPHQHRTAVDAIKTLLLYNETESARALWVLTQNQQRLSKSKTSTDDPPQDSSREKKRRGENQFRMRTPFSWPLPQFTRSDVLQSSWVQDLKHYLEGITTGPRQISVVTANQEHQEVVLNWLVSAVTVAKVPLRYILVLSLSAQLHDLLRSKKVNSVYIPPSGVISKAGLKRITTAFNQIHIVRLTLFRLMNHWNYDVVMYDSDAVVLKDPQPLFDNNPGVELIGSAGKGPDSIGHVWGRTICTGVLLMRSSTGLELWWEKMSQVARLPFTDQGLVNLALKSLHVRWDKFSPLHTDRDMRGSCPGSTQLQALVLSEEKICRYSCESHKRSQYYVWHKPAIKRKRTVENKKKRAREGGAWFLREDWAQVSKMSSLTGVTWLLAISHN